jgi:hypothetical protein
MSKVRIPDDELYEKLRAEINTVSTAYLQAHPDEYRVYLTLQEFEKDEVRQYLRTFLMQRTDEIGQFWTWVYWRSRDQRINYSELASIIGKSRAHVTKNVRPQAVRAYAEATVKALKFLHSFA